MEHYKILRRDNGSRVKITIQFSSHPFFGYTTTVHSCSKGKRTWINVVDTNYYIYRDLDMEGRRKYEVKKQNAYVTKQEILETKLELWEEMKQI